MSTIRIVIADDHTIVRGGVRLLLEKLPDVAVVGEASDGSQAIDLVRLHQPDILVADIAMPGSNGLEVTRRLSDEGLPTRVVILSMHSDPEYVHRAVKVGARGYVLKRSAIEELELAVRAVVRGELFLSPSITGPIVDGYLDRGSPSSHHGELTPRQREVLEMIARGQTTKAIANRLGISVKTVEAHRAQVMDRLQIYDVPGLVRYAIRVGLTSSDE
ncbi:Oxygen regulatory protein NreC [Aquisphaera giovannonii]|uniref:Oxygen regulatory protein NreC n=1 Tax=Aquisphaera giovannonii TaxID=406548 RepID=A0A5B9VZ52_9BACT|nr:response regulator transcription factor [Aquisphaera giovannonii]QEH33261.1 Oxygen regulatory protein NreC [Aquisphaera giovannonii]